MPAFVNLARQRLSTCEAWLVGGLLLAGAIALRLAAPAILAPCPILAFVAAVMLAARLCGPGVAFWMTASSIAAVWLLSDAGRAAPGPSIGVADPGPSIGVAALAPSIGFLATLATFALAAGLAVALVEALTRSSRQLADERARSAQFAEAQRLMFQELQHRVANNMQLLSSLLTLQARRVADNDARAALMDTTRRIDLMARLHRRLHDPEVGAEDFGTLVEAMCRDLLEATDIKNVVCRVDVPSVKIPLDQLTSLSLIINELMTNAIKHAFSGGRPGTISIALRPSGAAHYLLEVRDDGPGLPAGFALRDGTSLGVKIMQSMAMKLGGQLLLTNEGGVVARLEFAA